MLHDFFILFGGSLFCFVLRCFVLYIFMGGLTTIARPSKNNCELFELLDCRDQSSNKRKGRCLIITQWRLFRCFTCHNWGSSWA